MIFNQSLSRTFEKSCKNSTNKKDRRYLFAPELSTVMNVSGRKLRSGKEINKISGNGKSAMKVDPKIENKKVNTKAVTNAVTKTENKKVNTKAVTNAVTKTLKSNKTNKIKEKKENESTLRTKRKSRIKNRTTKHVVLSSKRKANIPETEKSMSFRQMSLKESFSNQEALSKRLRPRKDCRNYCEDSVVRQTSISSKQKNNPTANNELKLPVYKSIKLNNETLRNVSDVYDFKFDENDSKEKLMGKRKKRIVKRTVQKKTKKVKCVAENKLKVAQVALENLSNDAIASIKTKKIQVDTDKEHVSSSTDVVKKSDDDVNKQNELMTSIDTNNLEAESNNVKHLEAKEKLRQNVNEDNEKAQDTKSSGLKIISVKNVNNAKINITPLKLQQKIFTPFRKTNIFDEKVKSYSESMINDSLISKSLSPIKKLTVNFDAGSPWRLSPVNTFSQIRNLFQSTPQPRMLQVLESKKKITKDEAIKCLETAKKNKESEIINEDVNMQKTLNYSNRKVGHITRKFGREITNLDNSVPVSNENVVNEQYEEMENNKVLRFPTHTSKDSQNTIGITLMDTIVLNDTEKDKENAAPKSPSKSPFKSPSKSPSKAKKLLKKRLRKTTDINFSPKRKKSCQEVKENSNIQLQLDTISKLNCSNSLLHSSDKNQEENKDIFEPQPGPSGLQSFKSPSHKPLQQTNLNAFLNVMEMPESTRINTTHGIFDDAQSTPIYGKPFKSIKAINTKRMELDNAFGFNDDSDTILGISPINPHPIKKNVKDINVLKIKTNVEEIKRPSALPVRILPKEINQKVVPEKVNADENNKEDKDDKKEMEKENVIAEEFLSETKNRFIDAHSFTDTFDIFEETKEVLDKSLDTPMFNDFPTHFREPPRRSYKRKRNVRFDFHEDDSDEQEDNDQLMERKKKKHGKLKKSEVKRLEKWVESINETFQEIDHYELVVE
ncbi:hypothetical protein M0802_011659 [Mischocyttarus mexicanus]|nr:hypothetical protein M0802_011659 [Mischocyttarus mexicanus]